MVDDLRVFRHIGFFYALMTNTTPIIDTSIAEELARVASRLQEQRTGHPPKAVTVILGEDTLVVTLHEALTQAERALSQTAEGAAQVQEFHRQLFANSTDEMLQEIRRITGREVREAGAEIETATGTIIHAFTTGAMVQVYLLTPPPWCPLAIANRSIAPRTMACVWHPRPM